ncbi:MAG: Asp23/Gls24 family envelope stress response protein [Actinomycetota bacterium]|nr:Asp23/Gls24 family envelope stress response protein [Actinomycetota bacterium]
MTEDRTEQQRQESPLQTERGGTRIEDSVVSKIAGIAAQEVEGVRMGGGTSQAIGGIISSVTGGGGAGGQSRGVSVEVGTVETAVDLTMTVEYGKPIPQISEAVRRNVINRIENLVGLNVTEVNISVNDVFFPEQEQERQGELEQQAGSEQRVR